MADLKIIDKNMKKLIEWVNVADVTLMEMDKLLKSNDSDIDELKKSFLNLKEGFSDISTIKIIIETLQKDLEKLRQKDLGDLNKNLEEIKKLQKYDKEELMNLLSVFDNRLQNLEKLVFEKNTENSNDPNNDKIEDNDLSKSENNSRKSRK